MTKTIKLSGGKGNVEKLVKALRHIEYLGQVGASRNILIRVDGDGDGIISVKNEDGTKIDEDKYNVTSECVAGTYDIG